VSNKKSQPSFCNLVFGFFYYPKNKKTYFSSMSWVFSSLWWAEAPPTLIQILVSTAQAAQVSGLA
jgi:hypothetical protein